MHALAERTDQKYSVILTDIDHLESVNDTYGHPTGDQVLKRVAAVVAGGCAQDRHRRALRWRSMDRRVSQGRVAAGVSSSSAADQALYWCEEHVSYPRAPLLHDELSARHPVRDRAR